MCVCVCVCVCYTQWSSEPLAEFKSSSLTFIATEGKNKCWVQTENAGVCIIHCVYYNPIIVQVIILKDIKLFLCFPVFLPSSVLYRFLESS